MSSSSTMKQRKHNDQTVLQVVSDASAACQSYCRGLVLIRGGGFRCIHMEKDGNVGSEWVCE